MSKRTFYIKMFALVALTSIGHRIVDVVKTTQVVNNNTTVVEKPAADTVAGNI